MNKNEKATAIFVVGIICLIVIYSWNSQPSTQQQPLPQNQVTPQPQQQPPTSCCPSEYTWNTQTQTCVGTSGYAFMCANDAMYSTDEHKCVCNSGTLNPSTGCCS